MATSVTVKEAEENLEELVQKIRVHMPVTIEDIRQVWLQLVDVIKTMPAIALVTGDEDMYKSLFTYKKDDDDLLLTLVKDLEAAKKLYRDDCGRISSFLCQIIGRIYGTFPCEKQNVVKTPTELAKYLETSATTIRDAQKYALLSFQKNLHTSAYARVTTPAFALVEPPFAAWLAEIQQIGKLANDLVDFSHTLQAAHTGKIPS